MASSDPRALRCGVLLIGSELMDGRVRDLNLSLIARILSEEGLAVVEGRTVPDSVEDATRAIRELCSRHGLVVTTGGLGPTYDDVTIEAAASALRRPPQRNPEAERMLREKYRSWGAEVPECVLRQSILPLGALPVENPSGTAPGVVIPGEPGYCPVILLPGFPSEAGPLLPLCLDALGLHRPGRSPGRRVLRLWGVGESMLVEGVPGLQSPGETAISILPSYGRLDIVLEGGEAAELERRIRERFARFVYADSLEATLEETLGALLTAGGRLLSVAESCTGGLVAKLLTDSPGASAWFLGGVTAYSNALKTSLLGVPRELIEEQGAVSTACAAAMALGVRRQSGADLAGAVTGIAGPGGAVPGKPVGTVCFAVSGPGGLAASAERRFRGTRETIRSAASAWLLGMLRGALLGELEP